MLQYFIRFPEFTEFTKFSERSVPFRKNPIESISERHKLWEYLMVFTFCYEMSHCYWLYLLSFCLGFCLNLSVNFLLVDYIHIHVQRLCPTFACNALPFIRKLLFSEFNSHSFLICIVFRKYWKQKSNKDNITQTNPIQQDSSRIGCVPPACKPYVFWWQSLDVSSRGSRLPVLMSGGGDGEDWEGRRQVREGGRQGAMGKGRSPGLIYPMMHVMYLHPPRTDRRLWKHYLA